MSLDHATWAEIERLWKSDAEPLGRVARRFGLTHQAISARARQEKWQRAELPRAVTARVTDSEPNSISRVQPAAGGERMTLTISGRNSSRREMVERLFRAMETKLGAIEDRIRAGGDASPADSERTTRTLNTLVRSLEKLTDYEGKLGKAGPKHDKRRPPKDDPERRRQELARRIERLLARR